MVKNNTGEKIRIQRLTKNYSQEYMAFALGISQAAYSKLERGETEISLNRIFEIGEILEISAFELMPKPKYGTGINQEFIWRTLQKLRKFWLADLKKRIKNVPHSLKITHSDISNIPGK
jgi:transcriptional regulator with XRE-family HTH domain